MGRVILFLFRDFLPCRRSSVGARALVSFLLHFGRDRENGEIDLIGKCRKNKLMVLRSAFAWLLWRVSCPHEVCLLLCCSKPYIL